MEAKLLVVAGDTTDKEVDLKLPMVIGRSREADLTIGHPLVSRQHCEISVGEDGQLQVRDLGSLNGTFVGQTRVEQAALKPGALLTIGTITFRAVYGDYTDSVDFALDEDASVELAGMDDTLTDADTEYTEPPKQVAAEPPTEAFDSAPAATAASDDEDFELDWLEDEDA